MRRKLSRATCGRCSKVVALLERGPRAHKCPHGRQCVAPAWVKPALAVVDCPKCLAPGMTPTAPELLKEVELLREALVDAWNGLGVGTPVLFQLRPGRRDTAVESVTEGPPFLLRGDAVIPISGKGLVLLLAVRRLEGAEQRVNPTARELVMRRAMADARNGVEWGAGWSETERQLQILPDEADALGKAYSYSHRMTRSSLAAPSDGGDP